MLACLHDFFRVVGVHTQHRNLANQRSQTSDGLEPPIGRGRLFASDARWEMVCPPMTPADNSFFDLA